MTPEFVTFYADGGRPPVTPVGGLTGLDQIRMLWLSIAAQDPSARLVVLTDQWTDMSGLPPEVALQRFEVDLSRIMFERMRLQLVWLSQSDFVRPIVLIDTDTLVTGDLSRVFQQDFDLAFTWRRNDDMPINGGVIFVNNRQPEASRTAFADLLVIYRERYLNTAGWFGDQYAIQGFLGLTCSEVYSSPKIRRHGATIGLLPCDVFNFSPGMLNMIVGRRKREVLVHHFKGTSRGYMRTFFDMYCAGEPTGRATRWVTRWRQGLRHIVRLPATRRDVRETLRKFGLNPHREAELGDRAEIACDFLMLIQSGETISTLTDIGKGSRLKSVLDRRGIGLSYQTASASRIVPADVAVALEPADFQSVRDLLDRHTTSSFWLILTQDPTRCDAKTFDRDLQAAGYCAIQSRKSLNERSILWLCRKSVSK